MSRATQLLVLTLVQGWILRTPDDAAVLRRSRPLVEMARRLVGNTWGVPSSDGGSYRVTVDGWNGTCECYHFQNRGRCKHFWAARVAAQVEEIMKESITLSSQNNMVVSSVADVQAIAKAAFISKINAVKSPEEAMIRILTGMELGFSPLQSLRGIHNLNGKTIIESALLVALVKRHPDCEHFKLVESTDKIATYKTARKGEGETTMSFTIEQAKKAGLLNKAGPWQQYPEAMLRARASAVLARAVYPDACNGLYLREEIEQSPVPGPDYQELKHDPAGGIFVNPPPPRAPVPTPEESVADRFRLAILDCATPGAYQALRAEFLQLTKAKKWASADEYKSLEALMIETKQRLEAEAANAA